ncbi:MAG: EAL domain-containing protein, partial [Pseudomonadota bacterium]|nr:EAL domain-containing protein [Pseudomonadota bacterium]
SVELEGQRHNGSVFPLELTVDVTESEGVHTFIGVVRDITARREVQQALSYEKERLRVTLHSIGDAVITIDNHGLVTYLNPVAERLLRWSSDEAIGQRIGLVFNIVHQGSGDIAPSPVDFALSTGSVGALANDTMLVRRDGSQIAIEDSAAPILDASGLTQGVVLVFHDVTSARAIAGEISHQASHDPLTDLINRREFEQRLIRSLSGADKDAKGHVLLYLDLDQFKVVNDTAGHDAGDELLKVVSGLLRNRLRDRDHLARLGGDEFAILLEHCPLNVAVRIAETLRQSIADLRFGWKNKSFAIGVSIGLVPFQAGDSFTDVLSFADAACYIAKDKGRNRIHVHHASDTDVIQHTSEIHWAPRIGAALAEGRFVLYGQHIASIAATPQVGEAAPHYEVLVRMLDEQGELVPPMAFIPAAERYGLMPALDRWVVDAALAALAARPADKDGAFQLSINLSGKTLGDDTFIEFVEAAFRKHRVPHHQVCFEITETAAIANLSQAGKFINWFRQHGCLFSLDDFGAGMSSFSYLKHLRVDFIKIYGGFVKDILEDPIDEAMVIAINNIGHVMGLRTVAAFVENRAILERLQSLGVDFAQGYGIHRPEPLRELLNIGTHAQDTT